MRAVQLGLPPRPLADVVLGNRQETTCDAGFTQLVADAFKARGHSVAEAAARALPAGHNPLTSDP